MKFLQASEADVDQQYVTKELLVLYDKIKVSLASWIGEDEDPKNRIIEEDRQSTLLI